ncbi:MAG: nucleoside monophosphate kinase [Verrucomicrobia bacterium]|nr:nucleoside monophosphate kinase [Verrucomicrobiota bacterium]MDA1085727.1 nucleoside monophosphate kinase [Verrucomicrobiota bacterium]
MILLGGPGSGKGTAAEMIRKSTDYVHISTGDMLRAAITDGSPIGREAEKYIADGELVPDDVIVRIVDERLDEGGKGDAYIFDGFPRTLSQAELLDRSFEARDGNIRHVFYLKAPNDVLIMRLTGRRICRTCGANYHIVNVPPKQKGVCDVCGGELYRRADDEESTIGHRLDVYEDQTRDLIAYYEKRGVLVPVEASTTPKATMDVIMVTLEACES